ncbi:MAG: Ornithine carbamoyltransferase [Dehalococcoidia bacterium]|nr:Ornithine carbamoyltransferase [Chloroflexota bacterium]MBT9161309.1 Ornithine carbamoyltransferase [Chloroflexota bacterium]MBT9163605.1 Ornithine carbamoyltransferase [Chloroflexota bacterium]
MVYTKGNMKSKDLLSVADLSGGDLQRILDSALAMKRKGTEPLLAGQTLAMIFEKPSLRTRVSFDVAMYQLGGHAIYLAGGEVGLGTREPMKDIAQVLSRYANLILARTFAHSTVESLAHYSTVPVINGLSDREHPCQAISDLLTIYEKKGELEGLMVAYIGDGNNVAASLLLACALAGSNFKFASPRGYEIENEIMGAARQIAATSKAEVVVAKSPQAAARGADVVYTDVWTSMGQEAEREKRRRDFAAYQVTAELLAQAKPDAILMHPMPVHHGEELAERLIDCPQSVLIDQAENRLHAQKAILVEMARKGE